MNDGFVCQEIQVIGRVQGVFYRAFTQQIALQHNITGWVKNAPDGSVLIHACGNKDDLLSFVERLRQGPPAATVEHLEIRDILQVDYKDFTVTR